VHDHAQQRRTRRRAPGDFERAAVCCKEQHLAVATVRFVFLHNAGRSQMSQAELDSA
jgi:hypothetical protein